MPLHLWKHTVAILGSFVRFCSTKMRIIELISLLKVTTRIFPLQYFIITHAIPQSHRQNEHVPGHDSCLGVPGSKVFQYLKGLDSP